MNKSPQSRWRRSFASALVIATAIAISVPLVAPVASAQAVTTYSGYTQKAAIKAIFDATNQSRIDNGLPALRMTVSMNNMAQNWTNEMAAANRMYHNPGLAVDAPSGWTRLAENVAAGYAVDSVVEAWMGSPGHRANILNPQYQYIGIGVATSSTGRIYYTQNFVRFSTTPSDIVNSNTFTSPLHGAAVERIGAGGRYAQSVAVTRKMAPGVPVVYVANGEGFAGALAAIPAAAHRNAALLLTPASAIPESVLTEIRRLNPQQIVVVGGRPSVSTSAFNQLRAIQPNIVRQVGSDGYGTAAAVARGAFGTDIAHAYVIAGSSFTDGLSAVSAAGATSSPVVFVRTGAQLDSRDATNLATLGIDRITIVGGLSVGVETALRALYGTENVTRITGSDRYATNVATIEAAIPSSQEAYLALGTGFIFAPSGAALAGIKDAPLYLVPGSCIPKVVSDSIIEMGVEKITLLGATSILSTNVQNLAICSS